MKIKNILRKHRAEYLTAIVFIVVIFVMFIGTVFSARQIANDFLVDYRNTVMPETKPIDRLVGAIDSFERTVAADVKYKEKYIDIYGLIQKSIGKNAIADAGYGQLYKTKYGQITFAVVQKDVAKELESTVALNDELKEANIPFLYVQAPFKLPENEQQLPNDVVDYSNDNANRFLEGLNQNSIDYLDLRENYWKSGLTQNQLFFNTDHHWTIEGAFLGYTELAKNLNENYGFSIDPAFYDEKNYDKTVYKDFYIGSMGRRVGKAFGGVDDFTLITPKFDTNYTLYERDYGEEKVFEGDFKEAILTKNYITDKPLETNRYAVYHGDMAELQFINHKVEKGKILIIKDSFGLPIYSFMSTGVHEVRALDVRLFKGSVAQYAKEYNPDIVILFYNADCFGGPMFDFAEKE